MSEKTFYLPKYVSGSQQNDMESEFRARTPLRKKEELQDVEPHMRREIKSACQHVAVWAKERLDIDISQRMRIPEKNFHIFDQDGFDTLKQKKNIPDSYRAWMEPNTREVYVVLDSEEHIHSASLMHELVHIGSYLLLFPSKQDAHIADIDKFLLGFNNKEHFDVYNEILTETISLLICASGNNGTAAADIGYHTGVIGLDTLMRYLQRAAQYDMPAMRQVLDIQYRGYFTGDKSIFAFLKKCIGVEGVRCLSSIGTVKKGQKPKRNIDSFVELFSLHAGSATVQRYLEAVYAFERGESIELIDDVIVTPERFKETCVVGKKATGGYYLI